MSTETFIFYNSYYEAIKIFDSEKRLKLYDAITQYAFDEKDTEMDGVLYSIFALIKPLIDASKKNYSNGKKGGRPSIKKDEIISEKEIEEFCEDYKSIKNPDFEPTEVDKKQIKITLGELNGYNGEYWQKVFNKAKQGYLIDGKKVPCNLKKILKEHNLIFCNEAHLLPDKKEIEAKEKEITKYKQQEKQALELLDLSLDTEFFVYDDYRGQPNVKKLQAQKIYKEYLKKNKDEELAIQEMIIFLRDKNNEKK